MIIDDHQIIAEGFMRLLKEQCVVESCAVSSSLEQTIAQHATGGFELILLDINLPDGNGVELVSWLKQRNPGSRLIAISGNINLSMLSQLQSLGADGVYDKGDASEELVALIKTVLDGKDGWLSSGAQKVEDRATELGLSQRQREMLYYLGEGLTNKEISHRQSLSQATVAFHIAELKKKLGCKTSREILLAAREQGILS
ncbi:MAG: response regulator transcription factor [Halioglobus sp.]